MGSSASSASKPATRGASVSVSSFKTSATSESQERQAEADDVKRYLDIVERTRTMLVSVCWVLGGRARVACHTQGTGSSCPWSPLKHPLNSLLAWAHAGKEERVGGGHRRRPRRSVQRCDGLCTRAFRYDS
jgi:hypothetical protein